MKAFVITVSCFLYAVAFMYLSIKLESWFTLDDYVLEYLIETFVFVIVWIPSFLCFIVLVTSIYDTLTYTEEDDIILDQ